ncbi:MAG: stage V sporulation protein AB [Anaerostipes sp.]|nr:stage V sporulation protein AB [Anaerostipes sp.]MDD5968264.1 stage V sporulation protein AB [Anaerostipes sp.]
MEYLNLLLQGLIGISAGVIIAGSFLAFLSMIGIIPRIAAVTKTMDHAVMFEDAIVLGAVLGNVIYLYSIQISLGWIGLVFYGFFGGFFVGCLAAALAEVLKSVPIFSRRIKLRKGQPYLVYSLAAGKLIGSLFQFFLL